MKSTISPISLFLLLLLMTGNAIAQNKVIDSLQNVLLHEKKDTLKTKALNSLSKLYLAEGDFSRALEMAREAERISTRTDFIPGLAEAYKNIGDTYIALDSFPVARKYYTLAVTMYISSSSKNEAADVYTSLASSYNLEGNAPMALEQIYAALKLFEETGNKPGLGMCYLMLGGNQYTQKEFNAALENISQAKNTFEELGNLSVVAICNTMLGSIYFEQGNLEEALKSQLLAIQGFGQSAEDKWNTAAAIRSIGNIYEKQGLQALTLRKKEEATNKFNAALDQYNEAIKTYTELEAHNLIADTYIDLGKAYTKLGKLPEAELYLKKSLSYFKEHNDLSSLKHVYQGLAALDSVQGNFVMAYEHYKKHIAYKDSLFNEETVVRSQQLKMQYEFDKREALAKAAQARKDERVRRTRNLQFAGLGIVCMLVIFLFINNRQKQKAKSKIEKAYTELKTTQKQLIQSEKMASLGELTAGIAHEIQNPLNFVNNFSEVNTELIDEMTEELAIGNTQSAINIAEDIKENQIKITDHGKRADAIVKGMLQHSRSSHGVKEPTDINALADEYLRLAYHGLRAKDKSFNATMRTDFDESIGMINVIPQDIGRVILNLITNAFYAVSENQRMLSQTPYPLKGGIEYFPTVTVTTKHQLPLSGGRGSEGSLVTISVSDNGPGIPKDIVDKIFQPFFTTKPTGQGTGLGLSLSYDIVKAHGGELTVETEEGIGSTFVITLPII